MKRAARHFGERLGNALYVKGNGIRTAPRTNRDALAELERKDALNLFGNQAALRSKNNNNNNDPSSCSVEEKRVDNNSIAATTPNCNDAIRTAAAATLIPAASGAHTAAGTQHSFSHHSSSSISSSNSNRSVHSGWRQPEQQLPASTTNFNNGPTTSTNLQPYQQCRNNGISIVEPAAAASIRQ